MQTVDLNIIPGGVMPVVNVSQFDEGRAFCLRVLDGAAEADLSAYRVSVEGRKTDGNAFDYDGAYDVNGQPAVSVDGCLVTVRTPLQMTAAAGKALLKLKLHELEGNLIHTMRFYLSCDPDPEADADISDSELPAIIDGARADAARAERAAEAAEAALESIGDAVERTEAAAETATGKASEASQSAGEAASSAEAAAQKAQASGESASQAAASAQAAAAQASDAAASAGSAEDSAESALFSANSAAAHASQAAGSAESAGSSATKAGEAAEGARVSAEEAAGSAKSAAASVAQGTQVEFEVRDKDLWVRQTIQGVAGEWSDLGRVVGQDGSSGITDEQWEQIEGML